jgi:hypothetical protein
VASSVLGSSARLRAFRSSGSGRVQLLREVRVVDLFEPARRVAEKRKVVTPLSCRKGSFMAAHAGFSSYVSRGSRTDHIPSDTLFRLAKIPRSDSSSLFLSSRRTSSSASTG